MRLCVFGYPGCFYRVVGDFTGFGFPEGSRQRLGEVPECVAVGEKGPLCFLSRTIPLFWG